MKLITTFKRWWISESIESLEQKLDILESNRDYMWEHYIKLDINNPVSGRKNTQERADFKKYHSILDKIDLIYEKKKVLENTYSSLTQ